mgnify:FL=1
MNDFFNKPEDTEPKDIKPADDGSKEPEKIKIGEEEYSADELKALVNDGKFKRDVESKQNTKIDRVMSEWTKATQENAELRKIVADIKRENLDKKPADQLTPQEIQQKALEEADKLGLIHRGNVRDEILSVIQGQELVYTIREMMDEAKTAGKPTEDIKDFLEYMQRDGYKNPSVAYKERFDKELSAWEKNQVTKLKKEPYTTLNKSVAGSKQPDSPGPTTRDNFSSRLREVLHRE